MARLDISHSTRRIRIYLFNDRIRIRKAYEAAIQEVISSEINWSGISLATVEFANEFAGWLGMATDIAETLDRLIKTEADFKRVVLEEWPVRSGAYAPDKIEVADYGGQIHIIYPAAWVKD